MDVQTRAEQIRREAGTALAGSGVELDDVAIHPAGRRRLVRLTVVRDLSGVAAGDETSPVDPLSLDEIAEATRLVSQRLDEAELMGQAPYTLEVSSPGVDQPLTTPEQFRRNVGRLLAVQLQDGSTLEGRLVSAGPTGVRLSPGPEHAVTYQHITRAGVQVEFSRPGAGKDT